MEWFKTKLRKILDKLISKMNKIAPGSITKVVVKHKQILALMGGSWLFIELDYDVSIG